MGKEPAFPGFPGIGFAAYRAGARKPPRGERESFEAPPYTGARNSIPAALRGMVLLMIRDNTPLMTMAPPSQTEYPA